MPLDLKIPLASDKTLVIILGAEQWPNCPSVGQVLGDNPFRNSARRVNDYFRSLGVKVLGDFFDSPEGVTTLVEKIQQLVKLGEITDLFFYYVGHGTFDSFNNYCLLIRSTNENHLNSSSFRMENLGDAIKDATQVRRYIILDACFSGSALEKFKLLQADGSKIVEKQVFKAIPQKGSLLFCSSSHEEASKILKDKQITMFTDAFLNILEQGDSKHPSLLSFQDLCKLSREFIQINHANQGVAPVLYPLHQSEGNLGELGIFPNPKFEPSGPKRMTEITWHIITSGKGGVGKTLLSLFLVTHYVDNAVTPLVIDLNGVNTDLKRFEEDKIRQGGREEPPHLEISIGESTLIIVKVRTPLTYLLGWITNPYMMYTPTSFFNFLSSLRSHLPKEIRKKFGVNIKTIIIDTNYHFCNLFPKEEDDGYRSFSHWETDRFFIWFIWVYRQIYNCYQQRQQADNNFYQQVQFNTDVNVMLRTASTIERVVTAERYTTPFVHVINPMSLTESSPIQELLKVLQGRNVQIVPELKRLAALPPTHNNFRFENLVDVMENAQDQAGVQQFSEMLRRISLMRRPKNLFTFYTFQENLAKGVANFQIQDLEVYKIFEQFFAVLLEKPND